MQSNRKKESKINSMIEVKNLGFRYSKNDKWVFRNLNYKFSTGERIGLIGESGIGKSTFAKLLAGYEQPTEGEILLNGTPMVKGFRPIQLIHQHPEKAINPRFKMKDVLAEGFELERDMMSKMGIEAEWLNRFSCELSGGEMQRFCIARSLGLNTRFIIADEISAMLDVITQAQMWKIILSEVEKKNMGLIAVTHDKQLANKICTRFIDFDAFAVV